MAVKEMLLLDTNQEGLENNFVSDIEKIVRSISQEIVRQVCLEASGYADIKHILPYIKNPNLDKLYALDESEELDVIEESSLDLVDLVLGMNQSELVWQLWCKKINPQAISSFNWFSTAATFDFFITKLDCYYDPNIYQLVEKVVRAGLIIFPFEGCCFVCDRPTKLLFDNQNRFHAEGEAAIQFADGHSFYFYHGVTLPEKYGKVHPQQWQAQWLLTETNAELRRVLIQGIGYARICQELQAVELDSWAEYTLLQIDNPIDVESIYLLKMTCPSTGFVHVLRVPPQTKSAREAIRWVNWGVDPEDFSIQT